MREMRGAGSEAPNVFRELSDRELEVLRLIAEIAKTLFVSEQTVNSHVSNILSKLHLADRTQAERRSVYRGAAATTPRPASAAMTGMRRKPAEIWECLVVRVTRRKRRSEPRADKPVKYLQIRR